MGWEEGAGEEQRCLPHVLHSPAVDAVADETVEHATPGPEHFSEINIGEA